MTNPPTIRTASPIPAPSRSGFPPPAEILRQGGSPRSSLPSFQGLSAGDRQSLILRTESIGAPKGRKTAEKGRKRKEKEEKGRRKFPCSQWADPPGGSVASQG